MQRTNALVETKDERNNESTKELTAVSIQGELLGQLEAVRYVERRNALRTKAKLGGRRPRSRVNRCSEFQSCRNVLRVHDLQQPRLRQHHFPSCNTDSPSDYGILPRRPELPHADLGIVVSSQREHSLEWVDALSQLERRGGVHGELHLGE